jgi:predicted O-methyltransferase YrrM
MNTRTDLLNHFIRERGFRSFLEIGTADGANFRAVECEKKVNVDPNAEATFRMTSDDFFHQNRDKFDLVFIDGFHEWHQALRDANNALNVLNKCGVIVMHDCHPDCEECSAHVDEYRASDRPWCGDVWKAFAILRSELRYKTYVWDHDWGCGVIDTAESAEPAGRLPDVERLTFADFVAHHEWMGFVNELDAKK